MKKTTWFVLLGFFAAVIFVYGCGKQNGDSATVNGEHNPAISASDLFDVSGATAIAAASSSNVSTSTIRASQPSNVTELLKLDADGEISSVLSSFLEENWHPPITVIEVGPDGSLYVGFQWGIWIQEDGGEGKSVAFFRIRQNGTVEVVDEDIYGVGTWYGHSENGELPLKQVQFDSDGNIYYLGTGSSGSTVLKKKTVAGTISQIGNDNMAVRDFLVCPNGFVLFHGSNARSWSIEWLRVINTNNEVSNIFYNDGNSGWLRAFYNYIDSNNVNYVYLVGENLTLLDENEIPKKYSGIIKVALDSTGKPSSVVAIYDDNNMYHETHNTIGDQLTWGYWDPVEMTNKKFFITDNHGQVTVPLTFETGVSEESVRTFIRQKYQSITSDTLDTVLFAGTTTEAGEEWNINNILNDLVDAKISGMTWTKWREENGLQGVRFGNAKQLVFAGGALYAVMSLDQWGAGSSKGDKLFQVVSANGTAEIIAFPQDTTNYYKSMSKVRAYGDYAIYLSNKVGYYKILRLDLTDSTQDPVDMIPNKTNIEIFNFNYNSVTRMLLYDVYDLADNTSYLAEQDIDLASGSTEISAEGYTITDVVPFTATN